MRLFNLQIHLYEEIAFYTIQSSMELAAEKGAYSQFSGSEWETGQYFERKGYSSDRWKVLREEVQKRDSQWLVNGRRP